MGCNQSVSTSGVVLRSENEHGFITTHSSFRRKSHLSSSSSGSNSGTNRGLRSPEDIVNFRVHISHVKGRNLVPKDFETSDPYVVFKWGEEEEHRTVSIGSTLNPAWGDKFDFTYACQFGELREKHLVAEVYDKNVVTADTFMGQVHFSLADVARGPIHYDVALEGEQFVGPGRDGKEDSNSQRGGGGRPRVNSLNSLPESKHGRLSFNVVMRQHGDWPMAFKGARVIMYEQHLNHTIKTEADQERHRRRFTFRYDYSDEAHNRLLTVSPIEQEAENPVEELWTMVWKGKHLPAIVPGNDSFHEILKGTLRVCITDHRTYFKGKMVTKDEMWGECWLQLDKLYSHSKSDGLNGSRKTNFEEAIWFRGVKVGIIEGIFGFSSTPLVAQLVSGVRTEDGISTASPVVVGTRNMGTLRKFLSRAGSRTELPKAATVLAKLFATVPKLRTYRKNTSNSDKLRRNYLGVLKNILELVKVSEKDSMVSFVYQTQDALQTTQELFISVAMYFVKQVKHGDFTEQQFYFRIVLSILRRGELGDLALLGFDPVQPSAFDGDNNLIDARALEIVLQLRQLLVNALAGVVSKLRFDGTTKEYLSYMSHVIAICMFRIPEFGDCVIRAMLPSAKLDKEIPEWEESGGRVHLDKLSHLRRRGSWSKNGETRGETRSRSWMPGLDGDPVVLMLNWTDVSSYLLDNEPDKIEEQNTALPKTCTDPSEVIKVMQKQDGLEKDGKEYTFSGNPIERDHFKSMEKYREARVARSKERIAASWVLKVCAKKQLYYLVCTAFMEEIFDRIAVVKSDIKYHMIPFYTHVLKSFLLEMKGSKTQNDYLIRLSRTMLANPQMIGCMTTVLFNQCSVYDITAVTVALSSVRSWVVAMGSWHTRKTYSGFSLQGFNRFYLPSSFDFNYFFGAMHILLKPGNHSQVVIAAVEFLYSVWDTLPQDRADTFVRSLLENGSIIDLMLFWEREVRNFFAHVLAYRIMQNQHWSKEAGSPAVGYEDFLEDDTEDPLWKDIDAVGRVLDGDEGSRANAAPEKIVHEDEEYGRVSFEFDTPPDAILRSVPSQQNDRTEAQSHLGAGGRRPSGAEKEQDRDKHLVKAIAALMREVRRQMIRYEEDRQEKYGDNGFLNMGNKDAADSRPGAPRATETTNSKYADEFTPESEANRIHRLPGGEAKNVLFEKETIERDRALLKGVVTGYTIPEIDPQLLVYAKYACHEYTVCSRATEELLEEVQDTRSGRQRSGSLIPVIHHVAVVKDKGEIKPALQVEKLDRKTL
eukprot:g2706.t1